jgi:uncharacterized MnhB-related membrane protein
LSRTFRVCLWWSPSRHGGRSGHRHQRDQQQEDETVPAPARRVVGAVLAGLGIALAVVGSWTAVTLGPSGEAQFRATSIAPGAIVVGPEVLNSVDVPVRITATRSDGGAVRLVTARSSDARAAVGTFTTSTVSRVNYPAGTLDLRASGSGALPDISKADVWRLSAKGGSSAELVVDQGDGPETAVVTSGDASALTNVTMTLTWANGVWLAEALVVALIGVIIAALALSDLWHGRPGAVRADASGTTTSAVTA